MRKPQRPKYKQWVREAEAAKEQREREDRELLDRMEKIREDWERLQQGWEDLHRRLGVAPYEKNLEVLGLRPPVTRDEVKAAYREKAKTLHSDHGGSDEQFKVLHEAYKSVMRQLQPSD
jgi:hypothetical protein